MRPVSVGQSHDSNPRVAYAVLDTEKLSVTEHRVESDIDRVQQARLAGLPVGIAESPGRAKQVQIRGHPESP